MNEMTTMSWSFEEDVIEYSKAGFEGIGILRQKLSDIGVERGVELLKQHGLRCSNLLHAGGFTGSDGFSFRDCVQDAIEAIQAAAALEADCLVLYSGGWNGHTQKHGRRLLTNAIRDLLPFAEEFGVVLALEPMHPCCGAKCTILNTLEETLKLIDPFESPFLKVVLDTYHFGLQSPSIPLLSDIAHRIAIVHLGDALAEPDGEENRCQLGKGIVPLKEISTALEKAGYQGFYDIELMGEDIESIDYGTLIADAANAVRV